MYELSQFQGGEDTDVKEQIISIWLYQPIYCLYKIYVVHVQNLYDHTCFLQRSLKCGYPCDTFKPALSATHPRSPLQWGWARSQRGSCTGSSLVCSHTARWCSSRGRRIRWCLEYTVTHTSSAPHTILLTPFWHAWAYKKSIIRLLI